MFENVAIGPGAWAGIQYAVGEQQSKRTQSGEQQLKRTQSGSSSRSGRDREQQLIVKAASSSWSGHNRGAAAGGGGKRGAAVEADTAIVPASSSWSERKRRAAAEADAIGEKQLFRELSGAGLRTVGEQGGSSWASEASSATCNTYANIVHIKARRHLVLPRCLWGHWLMLCDSKLQFKHVPAAKQNGINKTSNKSH